MQKDSASDLNSSSKTRSLWFDHCILPVQRANFRQCTVTVAPKNVRSKEELDRTLNGWQQQSCSAYPGRLWVDTSLSRRFANYRVITAIKICSSWVFWNVIIFGEFGCYSLSASLQTDNRQLTGVLATQGARSTLLNKFWHLLLMLKGPSKGTS